MLRRLKLEIWKSIHRLPLGLIQLWQLYSLQRLIKHTYTNTALYRDLWDKHGVKPSQFKQLSDLQRFPIINKKTFLAAPRESYVGMTRMTYIGMTRMTRPKFHTWRSTSGTSGEPFTLVSNNKRSPQSNFLSYRFLYWLGYGSKIAQAKLPLVKINTTLARENYRSRTHRPLHDLLTNTEETMKEMSRIRPTVLEAYPSILVEFAQATIDYPQYGNLGIKYAISYGENLPQTQREFIENILHCEVFARYGLEEFGVVGTECRYHHGLHVSMESFFLEIVSENGTPVPSGKRGRIIITDLKNYVMPFIRYDTGDGGYFLDGRCPCGVDGQRLMVEGRIGEFLTLGSKKVHHLEFSKIIKIFSGAIIQYQVAKTAGQAITLFIIRGPSMTELILEHIREKVQALIGKDCHLNIELVTEIKRTPQGKCQTLIDA